jgi:hypothetical protein
VPIEEIFAKVNTSNLEANLVNGVIEVLGVIVVEIDGDSITLDITATIEIDTLKPLLRQQIALYLGGGYTEDDITIEVVSKKRRADTETGTVIVKVTDGLSVSPAPQSVFPILGAVVPLLAALLR